MSAQPAGPTTVAAVDRLIQQDRGRDALRILRQSPPADGSPAEVLALQAQALATLAEFDAATEAARQALALDPQSARALYALGTVSAMQRRPNDAVPYFSRAITLEPTYAPPFYALGMLLLEAGDRERAGGALRHAQSLDPENWRYNAAVAMLEPPRTRAPALRAAYRAALAEQPGSLGLRIRLLGTYVTGLLAPLLGTGTTSNTQLGWRAYAVLLKRPVILTYAFLIANVAMFIFLETHGGSQDTATLDRYGAKDSAAIIHQGQWWRLITPIFLHAGLMHLLVNSVSLYYVGMLYERCVRQARFLYVYLLAGIGGSLLSLACSNDLSVGASGAIFGIFGALGVYFYQNRALFGPIARSLVKQVAVLSAVNLALPLAIAGVDGWGHVGGLITGIIAGAVAGPRLAATGPDADPAAALEESRPLSRVVVLASAVALLLAALVVLVIRWNPAGA
jgi:membrane associated rhomboid family serine protease/Tfp pilus assembly protein PilF